VTTEQRPPAGASASRAWRDGREGAPPPELPADLLPLVERTRGLQPWRRLFHAANGVACALLPGALGLGKPSVLWILGSLLVVVLLADLARLRVVALNALFFRMFPAFASPREAVGIASSTWYLVGIFATYALFPLRVAVPGILVLALADPAAGTLGRLYGERRLGHGTWVGSAAFLAVAFAVLAFYLGVPAGLAAALLVTLVEIVPWRLDDNVTVPVAAAFAAWVVGG
jgi:dolichol kinase